MTIATVGKALNAFTKLPLKLWMVDGLRKLIFFVKLVPV